MKASRTCLTCREVKPAGAFRAPRARSCEDCRTAPRFRICNACGERKPATEFVRRGKNCAACRALPYPSTVARANTPRGCFRCHEIKPADAFDWGEGGEHHRRRRSVCRECLAAEAATKVVRRATWEQAGVMVRRCSACREVKPLESEFYVSDPNARGVARWSYHCKPCSSKRTSQAHRRALDDPEKRERRKAQQAAARRRWRTRNLEKSREAHRRWVARVRADPKRAAQLRESARMYYRMRREREGADLMTMRAVRPVVEHEVGGMLAAAPLGEAVTQRVEAMAHAADLGVDEVADASGVGARRLRAWRTGEAESVQLDVADRAMIAVGLLWWEVYDATRWPDEHRHAARLFAGEEAAA